MSASRTPQRARVMPPHSPSSTPVRSPAREGTPSAVARVKVQGATASPQIKAALAALRSRRQANSSSSNIAVASSSQATGEPVTPARDSVREVDGPDVAQEREEEAPGPADLSLDWAVKGEGKLIEDAKRTGRLNLASRSLSAVPPSVYSALLPRSSIYHPSNRQSSSLRRGAPVDFTITRAEDDGRGPAKWFEQEELRSLNLANNEIDHLSEELGGFDELEFLDLHGNLLASLPSSIGFLENLTSLSLASNGLSAFPLPLLNLRNLRDLSLASNKITTLWPIDWRDALNDALQPPEASPSATPESAEKRAAPLALETLPADFPRPSRAPFPRLTSLSLSGNLLDHSTFLENGFELPPRLITLELASCGLTDSSLPPTVFGSMSDLKTLDLSRNEVSDDLFSPSLFPDDSTSRLFPSLDTLDLSLCPIDSLETIENFFTRRVRRPISYVGVPKVVENLIKNGERKNGGRRIGVPADLADDEKEGREVRVLVKECMLRLEQGRRRANFPPTETSLARDREQAELDKPSARDGTATSAPRPRARLPSPIPPPSPSPSGPASPVASSAPVGPSTPSRRRPVALEHWEIETAAGLLTPAGRRKAAAAAAKEKEERLRREREEVERRSTEKLEEERRGKEEAMQKEREKQDAEEMVRKMGEVKLDDLFKEEKATSEVETPEGSPPPYSPRPVVSGPQPTPPTLSPTTTKPVEATGADEAVALVASAYAPSQGKTVVNLASRSLSSLATPTSGSAPGALSPATHVDRSRNLMTAMPLRSLETWGWNHSLRVLNLSCNRITALELMSTSVSGSAAFFSSLDTLDLSGNFLPSTVASPFADSSDASQRLLSAIAALAPTLSKLSLRQNRLTSLSGISALLLPSNPGARGLKTLDLGENKIVDLGELCEVAERIEREGKGRWRCEELDLSMNEVKQLPPTLGLLPHSLILHLQGNVFRFPRRDVYENAGARQVLPWLRERLGR